jgi:hypothetical protein
VSAVAIELALKKQRLQMKSAELRNRWAACAAGVKPLCAGVDRVREAAGWLRRYRGWLVAAAVGLAVARPRAAFRWLRRTASVWLLWRRLRKRLAAVLPMVA